MAKILDFDAVQDFDQLAANGPIVRASAQLPSARYAAVAIGPDSDHDMVRVQLPGVNVVIAVGTVLPLPLSMHRTSPIIETVRDFDGHVQVLGLEDIEDATAAATAEKRTPVFSSEYFELAPLTSTTFELIYAGRDSASIMLASDLIGAKNITLFTYGKKVRLGKGAHPSNKFVSVPLNTVIWGTENRIAWSESEPQFDFIEFVISNTSAVTTHALWAGLEAR